MCMLLYFCALLLVIAGKLALNAGFRQIWNDAWNFKKELLFFWKKGRSDLILTFSLILGVSFAASFVIDKVLEKKAYARESRERAERKAHYLANENKTVWEQYKALPLEVVDISDSPSQGPIGARVTLVEISDFECPFCGIMSKNVDELMQAFPGQMKVVFKNYPLDNKCNSSIKRDFHKWACQAAKYARCAFLQGKFWPVYHHFFAHQENYSEEFFAGILDNPQFALNKGQMELCLKSRAQKDIERDLAIATHLDIKRTPTVFLNGKRISEVARSVDNMKFLISEVLKQGP